MNENNNPLNSGEMRPRTPRPTQGMPRPQNPQGRVPQGERPQRAAGPQGSRPMPQGMGEGRPASQRPPQQAQPQNPQGRVPQGERPQRAAGPQVSRPMPQGMGEGRPASQRPAPHSQGQGVRGNAIGTPGARNPQVPGRPPMSGEAPAGVRRPAPQRPQGQPSRANGTPDAKATQEPRTAAAPVDSKQTPVQQEVKPAQTEASTSATATKPEGEKKKKTTLSKAGAEMMSSVVKAIIYIVAVFVVAIFLSIIIIRVGNDVFALVKSDEAIDITIPEEATISDVGEILHENSIISFPGLFTFYGNLKHDDGVFIAGDYTVSPSMSYDDLRAEFKPKPVTGTSWITIPEGYTVDEIISLMVSYGIGDRETYIDVINNYEFDYWFVKEIPENDGRHYRLEGYLFPDTYEFYNSSSEVTVINKLLSRFNEVVVQDYRDRVDELNTTYGFTDERKLTFDDIIIIASLIEKEAGTAADYRYVSSVFHNRLTAPDRYPKLESDATTVYAMQLDNKGVRPEDVSANDIRNYDSPYNTYKNNGLTPGAIANPSASAIRYALYPFEPKTAEEKYYFFVAGVGGVTKYACTQAEHDANIAEIKQQMEQMGQ